MLDDEKYSLVTIVVTCSGALLTPLEPQSRLGTKLLEI